MSDRDSFREQVNKVDGLFSEAELDGTRFVIGCESSEAHFTLSLLDVPRQRLAERELTFEMTDRTRAAQRVVSWADYFAQIRNAFKSGSLILSDDATSVTVLCFAGGRQSSFKFDLLPVDGEFVRAKVARLIFGLVRVARRSFELDDELRTLRAELDQARRAPPSPSPSGGAGAHAATLDYAGSPNHRRSPMRGAPAGGGGGGASGARAAPPKRQPGFSIVNPRSRRRVVAGAKLAVVSSADSASPARAAAAAATSAVRRADENDDDDDDRTESRDL